MPELRLPDEPAQSGFTEAESARYQLRRDQVQRLIAAGDDPLRRKVVILDNPTGPFEYADMLSALCARLVNLPAEQAGEDPVQGIISALLSVQGLLFDVVLDLQEMGLSLLQGVEA